MPERVTSPAVTCVMPMVPIPPPMLPLMMMFWLVAPPKVRVCVPAVPLVMVPLIVPFSAPMVVLPKRVSGAVKVLFNRMAPRPSSLPVPER